MGCCGGKVKQIAEGYGNLIRGKKFPFTNERVRVCQNCELNYWIGKKLFCSECKCYIPAKARAHENTCPAGRWRA